MPSGGGNIFVAEFPRDTTLRGANFGSLVRASWISNDSLIVRYDPRLVMISKVQILGSVHVGLDRTNLP
jgi:hypothetical protein